MNEITEILNGPEGPKIIGSLYKYANWKIRKAQAKKATIGLIESMDLAHEAIKKAISQERVWNKERYPSLLWFLESVLNSLLHHESERSENRTRFVTRVIDMDYNNPGRLDQINTFDLQIQTMACNRFKEQDGSENVCQIINRLMEITKTAHTWGSKEARTEEMAAYLLACMSLAPSENVKPSQIADEMGGIKTQRIYEIRRKLSRWAANENPY